LSLKLLIDEDAQDKVLVKLLRQAGHEVITVNQAGLMSQPDFIVLDYARNADRILLTLNCRDFQSLHAGDSHPHSVRYCDAVCPIRLCLLP
jgi:predicted nuclease of predicted toxin-antitoxin system